MRNKLNKIKVSSTFSRAFIDYGIFTLKSGTRASATHLSPLCVQRCDGRRMHEAADNALEVSILDMRDHKINERLWSNNL